MGGSERRGTANKPQSIHSFSFSINSKVLIRRTSSFIGWWERLTKVKKFNVSWGMSNHTTAPCRNQLSVEDTLGKAFYASLCFNCPDSTDHYAHDSVKPKCSMWNSSSSFIAQAYQPKPRIRSKVPEREAPSQINPLSTLFYLATNYTNVLGKTALARIKSA